MADGDDFDPVVMAATQGRFNARSPGEAPARAMPAVGLQPLGLGGERDGVLYVPAGYSSTRPAPLVLMLHGANGNGSRTLNALLPLADETGMILLAPDSRGRTWDVLMGGYGPDIVFIDAALQQTFDRYAVDADHIAAEGFSDGASYAISIGIANGDLFTHVLAFSPGFAAPPGQEGAPRFFVSHGTHDSVLPIDYCSRLLVPALRRAGYEVRYEEFDGPHTTPPEIARTAVAWFLADGL
jgi:phospholipase/carboxylesterase